MSLPLPPLPEPDADEPPDTPGPEWIFLGEPEPQPDLRPSAWRAYGRNLFLFVLTAASIYLTGGPRLTLGLLSILLAHEMGHYVTCRLYRVDATLPFFIPAPVLSLVGTLGAFIRIRGPIPHRKALFDIGIAGPLAGFVVCLPVLFLGVREARVLPTSAPSADSLLLGDPLLFQWAVSWLKGDIPDGMTVTIGPLGLAAWFGLFLTALNLIPIGQLDGGHVTYALFRQRAALISRLGFWVCICLVYYGPNWLIWSILLLALGRRHPPTMADYEPVGRARVFVGVLGLAVFAVCFVPNPIVGSWEALYQLFGLLL